MVPVRAPRPVSVVLDAVLNSGQTSVKPLQVPSPPVAPSGSEVRISAGKGRRGQGWELAAAPLPSPGVPASES